MPLQPQAAPGRALRAVRRADPRRARPRRRPRVAHPDVRLPAAATCCSHRRAPAAAASGPCPTATSSFPDFALSPAQWDALQIPVSVAFFFVNSTLDQVAAFYPSPAGATESLLPLDTWDELVAANPELATLEPDVEAFLVRSATASAASDDGPGASATSCRSTSATSSSASCAGCGGASTAAPRRTPRSTRSSIES